MYARCVSCGFEGNGFEDIVEEIKNLSRNGASNENVMQLAVLLVCPKCGYQNAISNVYSTDEKIIEKLSKNKKSESTFT